MESEMDAELRFHIEAFAEDLVRSGVRVLSLAVSSARKRSAGRRAG